jgi:CheY-like chemotaxis protein
MPVKDARRKRIPPVEDEAIIAIATCRELERLGYETDHATTGEEAIAARLDSPPDLVPMDIDLGAGMDGATAAEPILASRDIPIVFLSSHAEPAIVERTERVADYGYVAKHSGIAILNASIRMAFRLSDAKRESRERAARLVALGDNIPGGGVYQIVASPDGRERRFTYLSAGMGILRGIRVEEAFEDPMAIYGQVVAEDFAALAELEEVARSTMTAFRAELTVRLPSGEIRHRLITSAPRAWDPAEAIRSDNSADAVFSFERGSTVWDGVEVDLGPG